MSDRDTYTTRSIRSAVELLFDFKIHLDGTKYLDLPENPYVAAEEWCRENLGERYNEIAEVGTRAEGPAKYHVNEEATWGRIGRDFYFLHKDQAAAFRIVWG